MSTTIKHVETAIPPAESFIPRHVGPDGRDVAEMVKFIGFPSLDALIDATVPRKIRARQPLELPKGLTELEVLTYFRALAAKNQVFRSFIGMGYSDTVTPPVIQRNIIENPGWYTAYTPYQAEIAQGRLEALLNFQTVVADLTALPVASASLLDEATAAAEAMQLVHAAREGRNTFLVADHCHPQTIDVVKTRGAARGIMVKVQKASAFTLDASVCGVLVQYPDTFGALSDLRTLADKVHAGGALVVAATDLLALTLLVPPGEWGADVAVGNSQRFGVPLGYGGPHAAFFATREDFKRHLPGRIIGVSRDAEGRPGLRMALQTREQHIRREKATSNVCTAQVLLAVMASMYAVWHGPRGLDRIASRAHRFAETVAEGLRRLGYGIRHDVFFDTVCVELGERRLADVLRDARAKQLNMRTIDEHTVGIAIGESTLLDDVNDLFAVFNRGTRPDFTASDVAEGVDDRFDERFARTSAYLTHPVFNKYHSETEMP